MQIYEIKKLSKPGNVRNERSQTNEKKARKKLRNGKNF